MRIVIFLISIVFGVIHTTGSAIEESDLPQVISDLENWVPEDGDRGDDEPAPPPDMSILDWDLEANLSLPFSWDRSKWVLSVSKDGRPVLVDRDMRLRRFQKARDFNAVREIEFLFFSRVNGGKPVKVTFDQIEQLPDSGFRKDLPTKILMHGWLGDSDSEVVSPLAGEYLKKGDVNVIGVNWTRGAKHLYDVVRDRVPMVADLVAKVIRKLLTFGQVVDQIGLIGHSLGAHVAGLAGKKIQPKVAYIVGLDPALPGFQLSEHQKRLADTDAQYVEVIHTNGDFLAFFANIGTADFYPNGGKKQPGCGWDLAGICAHSRSVAYFKESLMAKGYFANRCPNLDSLHSRCSLGRVEFGEVLVHPLESKPRGVYYFETNAEQPFLKTSREKLADRQEAISAGEPKSGITSILNEGILQYSVKAWVEVGIGQLIQPIESNR